MNDALATLAAHPWEDEDDLDALRLFMATCDDVASRIGERIATITAAMEAHPSTLPPVRHLRLVHQA